MGRPWVGRVVGAGIGVAVNASVTELLKNVVHEKRPDGSDNRSFPSRHAFCAFLIATMFAVVFRSFGGMVPLLLATALGVARVLEGVHFPRDVVAGAVLGVAAGFACMAAMVAV